MHSDSENVNNSLSTPLGSLGIHLFNSLPGNHAHLVERYIQTIRGISNAMLSPLPYNLHTRYYL